MITDADIAAIRNGWADLQQQYLARYESYFVMGRLLTESQTRFPNHAAWNRWYWEQNFAFPHTYVWRVMELARREPEVRELLAVIFAEGDLPDDLPKFVRRLHRERGWA